MNNKPTIVVVEGKTDSARINKLFPEIKTIETNGSAISKKILEYLKKLSEDNDIVIFTDPDYPGMQIRQKISNYLNNNCKQVFIDKKFAIKGKKLGVAQASDEAIINALENKLNFNALLTNTLSWEDYQKYIYLSNWKNKICVYYNFPKLTNKTLWKWLNYLQIDVKELNRIILESGEK